MGALLRDVAQWLWLNVAGNLVASAITITLGLTWHQRRVNRLVATLHANVAALHAKVDRLHVGSGQPERHPYM